eukprot:758904-Hanusia_phi.AAC.1
MGVERDVEEDEGEEAMKSEGRKSSELEGRMEASEISEATTVPLTREAIESLLGCRMIEHDEQEEEEQFQWIRPPRLQRESFHKASKSMPHDEDISNEGIGALAHKVSLPGTVEPSIASSNLERHNQILLERLKKQEATLRHMDHHLPKRAITTPDLIPATRGSVKQNVSMQNITEEQRRVKAVHFSSTAALETAEKSHPKIEGAKRKGATDEAVKIDVNPVERMLIKQAETHVESDDRTKKTAGSRVKIVRSPKVVLTTKFRMSPCPRDVLARHAAWRGQELLAITGGHLIQHRTVYEVTPKIF